MSQSDHSCQEVLDKVYLCLDGELSDKQEKLFLDELNNCSCCLEKYNIEKTFKEFLTAKIERKKVNNALVSNIKSKINSTLHH